MKLSTLNSKLNLLSVGTNSKTSKGDKDNNLTAIMYLSSSDTSGYDVCAGASTPACKQECLLWAGRGQMTSVQEARKRKTIMFFEDQPKFLEYLDNDLNLFRNFCLENNLQGFVRLNGTSDLNFINLIVKEGKDIFQLYPEIQFYDYTKIYDRESSYTNYYLLYSKSELTTVDQVKDLVSNGKNVSVVFESVPANWEGIEVIDGDESDLRPLDKSGVVVGLRAKGLARIGIKKGINSGFVILNNTQINVHQI